MALEQSDFFDDLEAMSPRKRESYQNRKLRETINYTYQNAPSIKRIFDEVKISPESIRTTKDLEKLPITRKTDLIELQRTNTPYGGLITIPPENIERIFISPGPIYEPIQHSGIKWFAKAFWAAGFRKGDLVVNTFTYHLSPAGILFHEALKDCGATVLPMGTGNTEILIKTMLDLKITGFVGTPTFLMNVINRAEESGFNLIKDFSLERAWFTGEMLPSSLRKTFEEDYQIRTSQAYAVTEPGGAIAYECNQQTGMHLMDEYITEIVDPYTGKQLQPGQIGEVVVTPIHNKTWGLIRFGTGDMSSIATEPCPCGRTANKLVAIVGRTGDAIKVRGMFIVTQQASQAISSLEPISKFQLIVGRQQHRDQLTLRLELKEPVNQNYITNEVNRRFQNLCRIKIDNFEFMKPGTISEEGQPIIDNRTWD